MDISDEMSVELSRLRRRALERIAERNLALQKGEAFVGLPHSPPIAPQMDEATGETDDDHN